MPLMSKKSSSVTFCLLGELTLLHTLAHSLICRTLDGMCTKLRSSQARKGATVTNVRSSLQGGLRASMPLMSKKSSSVTFCLLGELTLLHTLAQLRH
jgi:hypothetical protein